MNNSLDVNERFALGNPNPVLRFDSEGKVLLANPAARELFDLPEEITDHLKNLVPEISSHSINLSELIESGSQAEFESRIGNSYFLVHIRGIPEDSVGHLYSSNITKLKQAQETLRSIYEATERVTGERFFEALVFNLTKALGVKAAIIAERKHVGTKAHTLAAWDGRGFLKKSEYVLGESPSEEVYSGNEVFIQDRVRALFPHDEFMQAAQAESYIGIPLKNSAGAIIGHLAVADPKEIPDKSHSISIMKTFGARAVTEIERLAIDRALRRSENRLHSILSSSPDLHITLNQDFIITGVYTSRKEIIPGGSPHIAGSPVAAVFPDAFCEELKNSCRKVKEGRIPPPIEFSIQNDENKMIYLSGSVSHVQNENEKMEEFILVVHDETEQKHTQMLREEMERIVRHDLKTPLNGIIGFSQLLQMDKSLDETVQEQIEAIHTSGKKMLTLINNSMNFFKMEAGTYELNPDLFNILPLFKKLEAELKPEINMKKISFSYSADSSSISFSDNFSIRGERILIENMLGNLLANAVQASPEGGAVNVSLRSGNKYTEIEIHNEGAIPEEIRERFFERYITSKKKGGTGLGTYSAKLISDTHGGSISFTTSDEEGTSIHVKIPNEYAFQQ